MFDSSARLNFGPLPDLEAELDRLFSQLPEGTVTTFGQLANAFGDIKAASWIGRQLKTEAGRARWPWHRVTLVDGRLPGSNSELHALQSALLQREGIAVREHRVSTEFLQQRFDSSAPLQQLRKTQEQLQQAQLLNPGEPLEDNWMTIAGLDVAYPKSTLARAAYIEIERRTGQILYQQQITSPCRFPYIPGYLSYREIPVLLELLGAVLQERPLADVLMIDGSGRLHPRQFGIACHLGMLLQHPTLGVSKKLLTGKLRSETDDRLSTPIVLPSEPSAGYAIGQTKSSNRLFVSPGHRLSTDQARNIALETWDQHPLPDPTYYADRLTRNKPLQ
ncbi:MAG: hypothetical protein CMJ47_14105 [Planctomyces sp.]|nr:hypothetical protein [Planctomyces sp.]